MNEVIGYKKATLHFQTGETVSGYYLWVTIDDPQVTGKCVDRIFASDRKIGSYVPSVGDVVDIRYNRYGKLDRIDLLA